MVKLTRLFERKETKKNQNRKSFFFRAKVTRKKNGCLKARFIRRTSCSMPAFTIESLVRCVSFLQTSSPPNWNGPTKARKSKLNVAMKIYKFEIKVRKWKEAIVSIEVLNDGGGGESHTMPKALYKRKNIITQANVMCARLCFCSHTQTRPNWRVRKRLKWCYSESRWSNNILTVIGFGSMNF